MQLLFALTLIFLAFFGYASSECVPLGEYCSGTFFKPCCANLVCELTAPFKGTCVACKSENSFCWSDSECCTKECTWGTCRKPT